MHELLCDAQGEPTQQQRISNLTIRDFKETPPSFPGEVKDPTSLKKALARDGDWAKIKEVLGWVTNTHWGTLELSSKQRLELISLLDITNSQRRISTKYMERIIGKIRCMYLTVPGAIGHFCAIQITLTCS